MNWYTTTSSTVRDKSRDSQTAACRMQAGQQGVKYSWTPAGSESSYTCLMVSCQPDTKAHPLPTHRRFINPSGRTEVKEENYPRWKPLPQHATLVLQNSSREDGAGHTIFSRNRAVCFLHPPPLVRTQGKTLLVLPCPRAGGTTSN